VDRLPPLQERLTEQDIEDGLRQLGLTRGDAVEVHSSLSSMGWVEGGADAVIEALMAVVGREGAIVMSCYPVSPAVPLTEAERARGIGWKVRILDPDTVERTGLGAVSDAFRWRPDVVCGTGLYRVCAWGHAAQAHRQGYQHLLDVDGWVLLIGVDIYRCSSLHLGERVPIPDEIARRFVLPDDILRDYPKDEWSVGYGGTPGDPWMRVWEEAERRGLVRHGRIGQAACTLFKAKEMVTIYETLRRTDPFGLFGLEEQTDRS
jgi:aminoglycoside 3-N-acetyltransferase